MTEEMKQKCRDDAEIAKREFIEKAKETKLTTKDNETYYEGYRHGYLQALIKERSNQLPPLNPPWNG